MNQKLSEKISFGFNDILASPFVASIAREDLTKFKELLGSAGYDDKDSDGNSPIFWALNTRNPIIMNALIDHEFFSECPEEEFQNAVFSTMTWDDRTVFQRLLAMKPDLYTQEKWKFVYHSINHSRSKPIRDQLFFYLKDPVPFDIDHQRKPDLLTLLHVAAHSLDLEVVQTLIDMGANPKLENLIGETPYQSLEREPRKLDKSGRKDKKEILEFLSHY